MKILMVNGSPHPKGCTYTALSEMGKVFTEAGAQSEIVWLGIEPIAGCIGCGACAKTGRCFRDDCVNAFIEKAASADAFVFGSPVHYAAASGAVTSFMARAFYAGGKLMRHKPAAAIVSARRSGTTATFDQLNKYFTINDMPVAPSQYWNGVHGSTPDDVLKDEEGLQTMRTLARNLIWLTRCIEAGRQAGILPPDREPIVRTNFIR